MGLRQTDRVVIGYMDKVDWDWELGAASGGNRVFPSVKDLKNHKPCWQECGIVEVEVRLKRIVRHGNFHRLAKRGAKVAKGER